MVTKEILLSHPVKTLKSEVSKTNIKGYSKMKKDEIIELMLKYKSRFSHIKKRDQKPKEKQKKKPKIEIPEITITEPEPEKRKVFQRGGRFFKPKEIKSKLPPIPKTNIKIRLPKEKEKSDDEIISDIMNGKKPINELRKTNDFNLFEYYKDLYGGMSLDKKQIIRMLQPQEYKELADKFGLKKVFKFLNKFWSKLKSNSSKKTYINNDKSWEDLFKESSNYLLGLDANPGAYRGTITDIGNNPNRFINKYYGIGDKDGIIKLPNKTTKPKEKMKPKFKFNKDYVKIEIKKYGSIDKYEIEFFDQDENVYIEMTLRKGMNNLLFLEHLSSQFNDEKPRAKKGYTRAMLCNLIKMVVNKGLVTLKSKFGLIAGDIGGITGNLEKKHNIKNLTEMYKSMGFNKKGGAAPGEQKMESTVGNVLEWCHKTYDFKKEEIKQVQQNKNDISEKGLLKEYEKDFKGQALDKSNIIRLIQPKQYNKLGKDLKLKNVFKLLNKVWNIVKKDYKTFGDIQNDNKSFEQLFKRNEKYLLGLSSVNDYRGNGISEIDPQNIKMFLKKYLM